ncbi:MAG: hypothetical protein WC295_12175, partial [Methanoregula sp.]
MTSDAVFKRGVHFPPGTAEGLGFFVGAPKIRAGAGVLSGCRAGLTVQMISINVLSSRIQFPGQTPFAQSHHRQASGRSR